MPWVCRDVVVSERCAVGNKKCNGPYTVRDISGAEINEERSNSCNKDSSEEDNRVRAKIVGEIWASVGSGSYNDSESLNFGRPRRKCITTRDRSGAHHRVTWLNTP